MSNTKTIDILWEEFKVRHYGKDVGNISRVQMVESEMIFKMACGAYLIFMREEVSELSDEDGVKLFKSHLEEIRAYLDQRQRDYNNGR